MFWLKQNFIFSDKFSFFKPSVFCFQTVSCDFSYIGNFFRGEELKNFLLLVIKKNQLCLFFYFNTQDASMPPT